MKKFATIFFACVLAAAVHAEEVNRTVDAAADGQVKITNVAGSVTVSAWKRSAVEVTGTLGSNVEELIFERNGDKVLIKVKIPRHHGRAIDTRLRIKVPENSSLVVGTVSADISAAGIGGEQDFQSVSGDIDVDFRGGQLSTESVSGDVEIIGDKVVGDVTADTVSGDVDVEGVSGEVSTESVSGDITIDKGSFSRAGMETVNGDVLFHAALQRDAKLNIDTVNGDLDIELQGDVSADFNIDTFNGRIRNCFGPKAVRSNRHAPGLELEFKEGKGDSRVNISTVNGDIDLCKS